MNKLPIELSVDLISQPNTDGLTGEEQSPIRQSVTIPVLMIEDTASLDAIAKIWLDAAVLAIDTEFERRTTFFAKLALVQIFDGQSIYLIDPLKVDCPLSLKEVFSSTKIIKVLHSSKEDLEVLFTAWNCKLRGLFDTQIAYHMIHDEVSIGYAKLVETFTGIAISKQQTQSDWTIRPLSTAQLEYAANDVVYLIEIYRLLECNLVEKNHAHLYREECDEICEQSIRRVENLADYRDAKEVWLLSELELSLFKVMFDWREKLARTENRTRNHIIKDQELVSLVKIKPNSIGQLKAVESIHPRSIRLYGELWLDLVQNWKAKEATPIARVLNPRDVPQLKQLSNELETIVKNSAQKLDIPVALLMSKRVIRKLAFSFLTDESTPALWNGWRRKLLADQIAAKKKQFVNS